MSVPNLLFIDTNIWLDFYRARNETSLQLLEHTEAIADRLIVTFQLETEFKTNRQAAMLEGMKELQPPKAVPRPGIFSDAKDAEVISRNLKDTDQRVRKMKARMIRSLKDPAAHDPVYKVCQRLFHRQHPLVLDRDNKLKNIIRRKAFRRFLHGCPPRKNNDTSVGDAFNWEWMVHCAEVKKAGLVIVSRDSDYGVTLDQKSYINDHLRQEFSERVSQRRELLLYPLLSEALKLFEIKVSAQEEEAEKELVSNVASQATVSPSLSFGNWVKHLNEVFITPNVAAKISSQGYASDFLSGISTQIPKTTKSS